MADRPAALDASGHPNVFDTFRFPPAPPRKRTAQLPLHGDIVAFL